MTQTSLGALQSRNPPLDTGAVIRGPNTKGPNWVNVIGWRPWKDFTFNNLNSIFQRPLSATWNPRTIEEESRWDHTVRNERRFDYFLQRFMFPVVNGALNRAASMQWTPQVLYICDGGWYSGVGTQDWGFATGGPALVGKYDNLLPGDSKLSAKWQPWMEQSEDQYERRQWINPVSQVHPYAVQSNCRYGYIITDEHFVALRFSLKSGGVGPSSPRPSRASQPFHQRVASSDTDISSSMGGMSPDSTGTHSYIDNSLSNLEYQYPEYAVLPWENYGRRRPSVKMALFCLCLMAAGGPIEIDYNYPPPDSWTKQQPEHGYIHNTSRAFSRKRTHGDIIVNAEDQASCYEEFADEAQSHNEEGLGVESIVEDQPLESPGQHEQDDDGSSIASGAQGSELQRPAQLKRKMVKLVHRNEGTGYKIQWKNEKDRIKTRRSDWREERKTDGVWLVSKKAVQRKV